MRFQQSLKSSEVSRIAKKCRGLHNQQQQQLKTSWLVQFTLNKACMGTNVHAVATVSIAKKTPTSLEQNMNANVDAAMQ